MRNRRTVPSVAALNADQEPPRRQPALKPARWPAEHRTLALDELGKTRARLVPGQLRRAAAEPLDSVLAESHSISERRTVTRRLGGAAGHGPNVGAHPDRDGSHAAPRAAVPGGRARNARNAGSGLYSGLCIVHPDATQPRPGPGSRRQLLAAASDLHGKREP